MNRTVPDPEPRDLAEIDRELGMLAGQAFARLRLEPQGYRVLTYEQFPLAEFDLVYARDRDVALISTLAGDQELDGFEANGQPIEAGSRAYVEYVTGKMHERAPDVATKIEAALAAGTLRYYEVRQPIDADGNLGDIQIREFSLG